MNAIRIAISAPMTVPMEHLREVDNLLYDKYKISHAHISYWDRKSQYDQNLFDSVNAVIVINNNFSFNCGDLAPGVSKELTEAYYNSKPVFVAYKNSNGQINFYSVDLKSGNGVMKVTGFSGIQGSSGKGKAFERLLENYAEVSFDGKPAEYTAKQRLQKQLDDLEKSAINLIQNSTYGSFGELDHPSKFEQVKFPKVRQVYANLIPNPDYTDERLLLML